MVDAMCTTGSCHVLARWADFDGLSEPWYWAFRTWLVNATTAGGATDLCDVVKKDLVLLRMTSILLQCH